MTTLLDEVKSLLKTNISTNTVRFWKVGVLPEMVQMPCVAFLPVSEKVIARWSGGKVKLEQIILIEVYSRNTSQEHAMAEVRKIFGEIQSILVDNFTISGNAIASEWREEEYDEPSIFTDQTVEQSGSMFLTLYSNDECPTGNILEDLLLEGDGNDLLTEIYDTLITYKTDVTYSLANVGSFKKTDGNPLEKLPAITLSCPNTYRTQKYAGKDMVERTVNISIWTRLTAKEDSIRHNLRLYEIVKDILMLNSMWGGYAQNSVIDLTEFQRVAIEGTPGNVNKTTIRLLAQCMENVA